MEQSTWTLDVGGISLTQEGPVPWLAMLAGQWSAWEGAPSGWLLSLERDAALPSPDGTLFGALPRFECGRCHLESTGFLGQIMPEERRAALRAHPGATSADLSYFVGVALAIEAFDLGAILFHAVGIVHNDAAHAFFGCSGAGREDHTGAPVPRPPCVERRYDPHPRHPVGLGGVGSAVRAPARAKREVSPAASLPLPGAGRRRPHRAAIARSCPGRIGGQFSCGQRRCQPDLAPWQT